MGCQRSRAWKILRIILGAGSLACGLTASGIILYESSLSGFDSTEHSTYAQGLVNGSGLNDVGLEGFSVSFFRSASESKVAYEEGSLLHIGEELSYEITYRPAEATDKTLSIDCSGSALTLDASSRILTASSSGIASVTFRSASNEELSSTFSFEVAKDHVASISFEEETVSLGLGEEFRLEPEFIPSSAENKDVVYESSDPSVARALQDGTVFGLSYGEATITATSLDNPSAEASVRVIVDAPKELSLSQAERWAYPAETISLSGSLGSSSGPFEPERMSVSFSSEESHFSLLGIRGTQGPGFALSLRYEDQDLSSEESVTVTLRYDRPFGLGSMEASCLLHLKPLLVQSLFDLETPSLTTFQLEKNLFYGDSFLEDEIYVGVPNAPECRANRVAYRKDLCAFEVPSCFELRSSDLSGCRLKLSDGFHPDEVYSIRYIPNKRLPEEWVDLPIGFAVSCFSEKLGSISLPKLYTEEDAGEINVLSSSFDYGTSLFEADYLKEGGGQASPCFASAGLKVTVVGDPESSVVENEGGIVTSLKAKAPGEAKLRFESQFEAEHGNVNASREATFRFEEGENAFEAYLDGSPSPRTDSVSITKSIYGTLSISYHPGYRSETKSEAEVFASGDGYSYALLDPDGVLEEAKTNEGQSFRLIRPGEADIVYQSERGGEDTKFRLHVVSTGQEAASSSLTSTYESLESPSSCPPAEDFSYVAVGERFRVLFSPEEGCAGAPVVYSSTDPSILRVLEDGSALALSPGEASIRCALATNPSVFRDTPLRVYETTCPVKIDPSSFREGSFELYSYSPLRASGYQVSVGLHDSFQIPAYKNGTSPYPLRYELLNNGSEQDSASLCSVDSSGNVKMKAVGEAIILISSGEEGSPYRKSAAIKLEIHTVATNGDSASFRKAVGHFLLFLLTSLAIALGFGLLKIPPLWKWISLLFDALWMFLLAYGSEAIQGVTPGRTRAWSDVWLDFRGALCPIALFLAIYLAFFLVKKAKAKKEKKHQSGEQ